MNRGATVTFLVCLWVGGLWFLLSRDVGRDWVGLYAALPVLLAVGAMALAGGISWVLRKL